jgi:formylglycine-generating enzyme required for sulfatase activity
VRLAHEALIGRWERAREQLAADREFLAWRNGLEVARRAWQRAPEGFKSDALLMGFALTQARQKLTSDPEGIGDDDRNFIVQSCKAARRRRLRMGSLVGGLVGIIVASFAAYANEQRLRNFFFLFAHVHALKAENERRLIPGNSFWECNRSEGNYSSYCPEMVVVPVGTFKMGSPEGEKDRDYNEGPLHEVTIAKPFAVSRVEVTFDQWDACVQSGGCNLPGAGVSAWGRGKQPAVYISWDDATQYLAWLAKITGQPYRLLSEAEWEYAVRAGGVTTYSFGDDPAVLDDYAWYNVNSGGAHPVGEKTPNAFGLYDMHGNVWEWVEDCYHSNYDYSAAPTDGSAWTSGDCSSRVLRGGSWVNDPRFLRSAVRDRGTTGIRNFNIGFRVGRTLLPP